MKTYAILGCGGGGGFVGVRLAQYLTANVPDVRVVAIGRNPERPEAFAVPPRLRRGRCEYRQAHLVSQTDQVLALLESEQPSVIVNVAAQSEEAASWTHSWRYFETNTLALAKLVEPMIGRPWLSKWIQVGTAGVYGHVPGSVTEDWPLHPATPYVVSKAAADRYLLSVSRLWGFPVNILRPSNLYGPGQQTHKIIPKAILRALLGRTLALHGGGSASKSYLYVEDFARAISLLAEKGPPGKAYNCGSCESVAVRDVVQLIFDKIGACFKELVQLSPARIGADSASSLDSSLIAAELGWSPQISLEKGLDETIAWAKQHLDFLKTQPTEFNFQA